MTTAVTSKVVTPDQAKAAVRKHSGYVEVEVNMIHDMVPVRVTKVEIYKLLMDAKNGNFNVYLIECRDTLTLLFTEEMADDDPWYRENFSELVEN